MIFNHELQDYHCPFCKLASKRSDEFNSPEDIVFESEEVIAFISPKWWINNRGHVIIIPKIHVENIFDIKESLLSKVQIVGKRIAKAMKVAYECDGISFRQHNEPAGNQDVWHYHLHVFPRYDGDNLYLNHNKTQFVSNLEKKPYVEKLVAELKK
jgi:histidine triad (HIT) family protein